MESSENIPTSYVSNWKAPKPSLYRTRQIGKLRNRPYTVRIKSKNSETALTTTFYFFKVGARLRRVYTLLIDKT
ncbi:hypothetical protein T190607A02C_40103 [Tenacibaculum sp. 190524A02b]